MSKDNFLGLDNIWVWLFGLLGLGAAALFLKGKSTSTTTGDSPPSAYSPGEPSRYYSPSPHPYSQYTPPDPVNYSVSPFGSNYAAKKPGCGCNKGKTNVSNSSI